MLHIKNTMLLKKMLGVLLVIIFIFGIGTVISMRNMNVISHDEKWISPFESTATTVYDLGNGFTSTLTTTTETTVTSVKHTDERLFSAEQWKEILSGIASGDVTWED